MRAKKVATQHNISIEGKEVTVQGLPEVYIYFGHNPFSVEWNSQTQTQDIVQGKDSFFGGSGEGQKFDNWQDAIHASLYDAFQVEEAFKDGDTFVVTYKGEVARFATLDGIHIIKAVR